MSRFLVLLAILACESAQPTVRELETQMAELINLERKARGLDRLALSEELSELARSYSRRMAATGRVHHRLDRPVEDRIRDALPDACHFGENVSKHTSIEYSLGDLMQSPGHRGNLLDPEFTFLGIGIARGEDGYLYITQEFARPCPNRGSLPEPTALMEG